MFTMTKDLEVGIPMVDSQHKELFNLMNAVESATTREEAVRVLGRLGEYIKKHFANEEALQKKSGYAKHEPHKAQHEYYISEFSRLKDEFERAGVGSSFSLGLITTWLVKHIKVADIEFGKFYLLKK